MLNNSNFNMMQMQNNPMNHMNQMNHMNHMNHMNQMNQMNNFYNNNFNNGFNQMNFNNNFQNYYYMQNLMNYNLIMQQKIQQQHMINNQMRQKSLQNQMNQILDESETKNTNINASSPEIEEIEETEEEKEEKKIRESLALVIKEQNAQKENFEKLQAPQNLDYNEIDPEWMHIFISDKELFCGYAHNLTGKWAHGENRGGRPYNPPDGWIGFGLNVLNKYDNGNNDWLACDGRPGEWCVAYHGACVHNTSEQIKQIIKPILEQNLKPGAGQAYSSYDDACHPGQKVGVGVYCSPNPGVADGYSGQIDVNGHRYKVAFMLRVKPDKIRYSSSCVDYWVLNAGNGDFSEMRPYRFLIKKVS